MTKTFTARTPAELEAELQALPADHPAAGHFIGLHMGGLQIFGPKATSFGRERIGEFTWDGVLRYLNGLSEVEGGAR